MFLDNSKGTYLEQMKEPALSRDIVVLKNNEKQKTINVKKKESYSLKEIIDIAREAEIIDDHTGEPLAKMLEGVKSQGIKTVVADAVNDEPYISNQMNVFLKNSSAVVSMLKILLDALDAIQCFIAVYSHIYYCEIKIPKNVDGIMVKKVSGKYPVEAKSKMFNSDDTLVVGAGALLHLYRAINEKIAQSTVFVTVAGDCIGNPANVEVSLGTPIKNVLEKCGLIKNPEKIILGNPMTGRSITDCAKEVISSNTNAVLAFSNVQDGKEYACIRCGKCEVCCPQDLNPMYIYKAIKKNKANDAEHFGAYSCIGCGTCSYICPAKLNLSSDIFTYKKNHSKKEEK